MKYISRTGHTLLFSIIWLLLGIQDRYLVELYRNQLKAAFGRLELEGSEGLEGEDHVSQVKESKDAENVKKDWHTQRGEAISSTKMGANCTNGDCWIVGIVGAD